MRGLGFSWRQTTVAKTEAAERPLRVDELSALAEMLRTTVPALLDVAPAADQAFAGALRWLIEAEAAVQDAEHRKRAAEAELGIAVDDLEGARLMEAEARARLADLGAIEADGRWGLPDGEH